MIHRLTDAARTLSHVVRDHLALPSAAGRQAGHLSSTHEYYQRAASIGYWIHGNQVKVLTSPGQFYDQLKDNIRNAKKRIVLSALYIGNGEQDLIQTLHTSLDTNPNTHLTILVDYLRGTRGQENSVTALAPLLRAHPDRVRIALYHTPELTGWKKRWIPQRFNETIGLLHFKLFATDDRLIISGANLSHDYFTNRQDRYMQIADANVTSHYTRLVDRVADISFQVKRPPAAGDVSLTPPTPCPVTQPRAFREFANVHLAPVLSPAIAPSKADPARKGDTLIVPTFQGHPLGIHQDEELMHGLWAGLSTQSSPPSSSSLTSSSPPPTWSLFFTSGYFNMTPTLFSTLFSVTPFPRAFHVLTAAPQANGFYQSRGVSRFIPDAYSWLEERFLHDVVRRAAHPQRVSLSEYGRPGWTFHAKGLWVVRHDDNQSAQKAEPVVTAIGSSNFGYRSARRDLEAQAIVVTSNPGLQAQLRREMDGLWKESREVRIQELKERKVHWLTKVTAWATKNMF